VGHGRIILSLNATFKFQEVQINERVRPVCLPDEDDQVEAGDYGTVLYAFTLNNHTLLINYLFY